MVVAAHNEADRIAATLTALAGAFPGAPLWVADDGSSDGTAMLARAAGARVVRSERVIGKGGAMTAAARRALDAGAGDGDGDGENEATVAGGEATAGGDGRVFVLCDGDLGDSATALARLADVVRAGDADVAVAAFARRVGGGVGLALAFARWSIASRCGLHTRAPISGQRALTAAALRDVLPFAYGYGMEIGMTIDAVRAGHTLVEVELDLSHRASGRTLAGFAHRARQLLDFAAVHAARRSRRAGTRA